MKKLYKRPLLRAEIVLPFRQVFIISSFLFFLINLPAHAQQQNRFLNQSSYGWGFIKNEGQLNTGAAYYGSFSNLQVFFYTDKVEFVARSLMPQTNDAPQAVVNTQQSAIKPNEPLEEAKMLVATMQMQFQNAALSTNLTASAKAETINNFFTNGKRIENAALYKQLRYNNIYPNIDLIFKADKSGLKYEFEVRPGGKVSDINISWKGADVTLKNGELIYKNFLGELTEQQPVSHISGGQKIPSSFKLNKNTVGFKIGKYPQNKTLVIDPLMRWATYYGGDSSEAGRDVAIDSKGNVYMVGSTLSHSTIATSGSFRDTFSYNGFSDAYLVKFSPGGKRIWGTYYGGSSFESAYTIAIDTNDNVYIGGITGSLEDIATAGAHQTQNNKGGPYNSDGFVTMFDSSGKLIWGTYYGGPRVDAVMALACDKFGHLYLTGYTKSSADIASANGHRTGFAGGGTGNHFAGGDAFLAKLDDKGRRIWATYYGGAGDDQGFSVATDGLGNVIIAGETGSSTLIGTPGSHQVNRGGNTFNMDGFIAKFDSSGKLNWGTYYGGEADDRIAGVRCDKKDNIYIAGTTFSKQNIATPGTHMDEKDGNSDIFIGRFSANGSRIWGTFFGGESSDQGVDIGISDAYELFFTGHTVSDYLATEGADRPYRADSVDVISGQFDTSGNLLWASYYGGEEHDYVNAMAVQAKGTFYITGVTNSTANIAVIGGHKEVISGQFDAFLVKYDTLGFCHDIAKPKITGELNVCLNTITNYTTYYDPLYAYNWEVEGGTILLGKYSDSVIIKWTSTGKKTLKLTRITEYACTDSTNAKVDVIQSPVATFTMSAAKICLGDSAGFNTSVTGADYTWHFGDGRTSSQKNIKHKYMQDGTYEVKLIVKSPEGCVDSVMKSIEVNALPDAAFIIKKINGTTYSLEAKDTALAKYTWKINGVNMYNSPKAKHTFNPGAKYNISLTTENASGCSNTQTDSLWVDPNSITQTEYKDFAIAVFPNPFINNTNVNLHTQQSGRMCVGLYDANGRYITVNQNVIVSAGTYNIKISAEELNLKPGIYMLHITVNDAIFSQKIMHLE